MPLETPETPPSIAGDRAPAWNRRTGRRMAGAATATASAVAVLAGVVGAAAAVPSPGPRLSRPLRVVASEPNVPSAVNAAGQALTLRPGSGAGPALQLATAQGPVQTIQLQAAVAGYNNPSVAIGDSGALAATWDTSSTSGSTPTVLNMAAGSFSSPPAAATALTPPNAEVSGERALVNHAGTAIVLWEEVDGSSPSTVRAAIVPAGAMPAPVTLDTGVSFVGAGLNAAGALIVVEQSPTGFVERSIGSDGTVGPPVDFALPGSARVPGSALKVLVDGAGDQLYSWASSLGAHQRLNAVWRSAGGSLGAVQSLGADVGGGGGGQGPDVALNASGRAVAVLEPASTGPLRVRFATRLGRFAAAESVGRAGRYADLPVVAITGPGRTLLVWLDSPRSARGTSKSRELVAAAHGTRFTPPEVLPVQAGLGHAYQGDAPIATADPSGRPAVVTYGVAHGSRSVGQLAFLLG